MLVPRIRGFTSGPLVTVIRAQRRPFDEVGGFRVATALRAACDLPQEKELGEWPKVPGKLRALIEEASIGADSETERRLFRRLRELGYPFEQNKLLGNYFCDEVNEKHRVVVEINGYQYHRSISALIKDYWKANDATSRGYRHLSFSDACIDLHLGRWWTASWR
ncbi:DUF559 domain-containing protein [Corynebacterium nasicanis]